MSRPDTIGAEALRVKGRWRSHRWLWLRRASQLSVFALFLLGPLADVWIVKGNLASSLTLDMLPLTDPYVLLQSLAAGHWPASAALIGASIVTVFYLLVGGRAYCAWVCPVNIVTDAAQWLRDRLGIHTSSRLSNKSRFWLLGTTFVLAAVTGTLVWELLNPVSLLSRGLIFGVALAWTVVLGVFLLDLLVSKRAWCGHLCPVGAFYSLLGHVAPLRVSATRRDRCNDCMDCFAVCPEMQVIRPALKGAAQGCGPRILDAQCTHCGRCIDVCSKDVFQFVLRFGSSAGTPATQSQSGKTEVMS